MFKSSVLFILFIEILSLPVAFGQAPPSGPCPPGGVPIPGQGRCGSPAEAAAVNQGGRGNSVPAYTEIWEDRYGALAIDRTSGNLYPIENESSRRRAIRASLKNCGNNSCFLAVDVRNGCIASSWGGGYFSHGGVDKASVEEEAMGKCRSEYDSCKLKYSGCSLPVRVK